MKKNPETDTIHRQTITKVVEYIEANLHQPLCLETLADKASFSPYHFHRIFRQITGDTPFIYIQRRRVEKAAHLISHSTDFYLVEIAETCGFTTQSLFVSTFRKYYGVTPHEYRKQFAISNKMIRNNRKQTWRK